MNSVTPLALIVDDEPDIRELLEITLGRMRIQTLSVSNLTTAKKKLAEAHFDLCLTDMRLPDGDGIDLVKHIQKSYSDLPVAIITAYGNMETAISALKAGAFDFVSKPIELKILRDLVTTALKLTPLNQAAPLAHQQLLGKSAAIQALHKTIQKLARSQAPLLISGASGTGKELVARLIHEQGPRATAPFIPVNCGAIPSELMESEFFGYLKGSFTGAHDNKQGLFQAAEGGTLFLDEVADLPLHMQVKLLRAIQEKTVRPVGSQKEISVDVRILSATHKNLQTLVKTNEFRQDLFYRINVIEIKVPSLVEHLEDLPLLAEAYLDKLAKKTNTQPPHLSSEALAMLKKYSFPGNIRELENILERAFTLSENQVISVADLQLPAVTTDTASSAGKPLDPYLDHVERDTILAALNKTRWNKTAAAKLLGITLRTLRYRLKKLHVE